MYPREIDWAFLIAGFIGLAFGAPLVLIICCATVLLTKVVKNDYLGYAYGAGFGCLLVVVLSPLMSFFVGTLMIGIALLMAAAERDNADE